MKLSELEKTIKELKKSRKVTGDTEVYFQYSQEGQDTIWTREALIKATDYTHLSGTVETQIEVTMFWSCLYLACEQNT